MFIIYLFIIVLLIRPQDWVPFLLNCPTHYLLVSVGFAIGYIRRPQVSELFNLPQSKLLLIYLFIVFFSTFLNAGMVASIEQLNLFFKRGLIYFLVLLLVDSEEKLKKTIFFLLLIIVLLGTQAIQQAITGVGWGIATPYPGYNVIRVRWIGDWDGPNVFGLLLAMGITMLFEVFLSYKENIYRILSLVGIIVLLPALFFTNSRGAFLAVLFTISFQIFSRVKMKTLALFIATVFFCGFVALAPPRMKKLNSGERSAHERVYLWEQGLVMLQGKPIIGIGKGEFTKHSYSHLRSHNNFVTIFAETGLLGFFCWMGILWFSFQRMYMVFAGANGVSIELKRLNRVLFFGIMTYCVATFFVVMENDLLFFLFGLVASALSMVSKSESIKDFLVLRKTDLIGIIGSVFGVLLAIWMIAVKRIV